MSTVTMRDPATLAAVRSVEDTAVPGPAGEIPIRIYRPDVEGAVPTMAFFHGGGFAIGSIATHDDHARLICHDVGVVVVSVDYRLAPEHPFPAGFDDCLAATKWVGDNVATLGGDAARIVVGGDSAGGNLSAAVALATRDGGPALAAQFLIYPGVDFVEDADYPSRSENAEGYFLTLDDMAWFSNHYLPEGADHNDPRASPIRAASLTGAPPAVIGTGEFDPLRDEGEAYAAALREAGVPVALRRAPGLVHGFVNMTAINRAARDAVLGLAGMTRAALSLRR
jgi:acetyl esterase